MMPPMLIIVTWREDSERLSPTAVVPFKVLSGVALPGVVWLSVMLP